MCGTQGRVGKLPVSLSPSVDSNPVAFSFQPLGISLELPILPVPLLIVATASRTWAIAVSPEQPVPLCLPALHFGCQGPCPEQNIEHVML